MLSTCYAMFGLPMVPHRRLDGVMVPSSKFKTDCLHAGLYTDESPGLKVDPVVVLVLSLGFIFSVVALHSRWNLASPWISI